MKYLDNFSSYKDIISEFMRSSYNYENSEYEISPLPDNFPSASQIIFAAYGTENSYSGSAVVLFKDKNGSLFIVNAGHCSCAGLEGQWNPSETTVKALRQEWNDNDYEYHHSAYTKQTKEIICTIIDSL